MLMFLLLLSDDRHIVECQLVILINQQKIV